LIRSSIIVDRHVDELRPHPRYQDLCGHISNLELFNMAKQGEILFEEPLIITNTGIILDGYKRWTLAHKQRRTRLPCLEYSFASDGEVLRFLVERQLEKHQTRNPFFRVLLALELEPFLRQQAKERQQLGGREKGWSNLTKDGAVNVRWEIARIAKVSSGNVSKVKHLLQTAQNFSKLSEEMKSAFIWHTCGAKNLQPDN